jgi:hypothetical protein
MVAGVLGGLLLAAGPAGAQAPAPDRINVRGNGVSSPDDLARDEFNLQTTGRLQVPAPVGDQTTAIRPPIPQATGSTERAAAPPAQADDEAGSVMALDTNMGTRVNELLACRMDVAAERRVPAQKILAGALLLRWTVQGDGAVDSPEVVALRDTDPDVLVCVKRKLAGWSFTRPAAGQPVHLEHRLAFR